MSGIDQKVRGAIRAADAAIGAAVRAYPAIEAGELISGVIALVRTQVGYTHEAADQLVSRIMVDVVQLVGARRAHEIIDALAKNGAGSDFS